MKIVALEEHFVTQDLLDAWEKLDAPERDDALGQTHQADLLKRLLDLGEDRVAAMDEAGVDQQILSFTTPGVQNLAPEVAVTVAARGNDALAALVRDRPDRFGGFASLPTPAPDRAAGELERAVALGLDGAILNGRTGERNVDHPDYEPIFEAAAALRAPLYLHPQLPVRPVRNAYYSGLGESVDLMFGMAGIGWHYETGVQLLRLVLSGVFDRHPDLQVITGHWGEVVLFYLDRVERLGRFAKDLRRPIPDYFRGNISITPSGIWSRRYLGWAKEVLGVERILFSTDYPYVRGDARGFLEAAALTDDERALIAHGNWDRLRAAIRR